MFTKVLIANRGEIVRRVSRTLKRMGIASVAVCSEADRFTPPVLEADESVLIGPAAVSDSYLNMDAILQACASTGAQAVHPGYGFLSERAEFAQKLADQGIRFMGPRPEHMRAFGLKHTARDLAKQNNVPLLPGTDILNSVDEALEAAAGIGYPVMLKSTAGGGGIGMQICHNDAELRDCFAAVSRMGGNNFGDARVFLEKFIACARHVEVQVFGDGRGNVLTLGERDCSLQRRNQKVIEETPAPGLSEATRKGLRDAARALCAAVAYESAGTVEFIYDTESGEFYFLEVNTRLQVEHCVTEEIFGIDLVEWMIRQADGTLVLPAQDSLVPKGAAVEARIYAENAAENFRPSTGRLTEVSFAPDVRVDGWIETGTEVTPYYDPMLAKVIARGATREEAFANLHTALTTTRISGLESNLDYLRAVTANKAVRAGQVFTGLLNGFAYTPSTVEVIAPGLQSTVQDWPGRVGYWDVGVPPSGPMDDRNFRLANQIVGNAQGVPALEFTASGPVLRFNTAAIIGLSGAFMPATLDGVDVPYWEPVTVQAGQVLALGQIKGAGHRTYLAVRGGIDAPLYLGSSATFMLGQFGGHATGQLRTGDVLRLARPAPNAPAPVPVAPEERPELTRTWTLGVMYGPHGAPDFFLDEDIETLFSSEYEVHFNSARTGVRLIGPKPRWARTDGGEAGLHPSNIHDNAYAIGAIDFTGDMPILLGPDGPSLGGFVCPAVLTSDELWKMGQLHPGDKVRFQRVQPQPISVAFLPEPIRGDSPILFRSEGEIPVVYRRAGDCYLLLEFGPPELDIALRLRVQLVLERLKADAVDGILDLTPGIRSLQVHYNPQVLPLPALLELLHAIEQALPSGEDDIVVPSRIVYLPVSWDDEQARLAMQRYQELVRPNAPWCPSNIEFIRRINGLDSIEAVKDIIFNASYLVMGLGDVYLGAPVATPIDPRHRLVTTKYNPARTWTPDNVVGIGGSYMCIYGMEGPGGYQLFGRTTQVWNTWRTTDVFHKNTPWLLRFFDQIRFYPVSHDELMEARAAFPYGRFSVEIEETQFSLSEYRAFLEANKQEIAQACARQQAAFEAERQDWIAKGLDTFEEEANTTQADETILPEGYMGVDSPVPGSVWQIQVAVGDRVKAGDAVAIIESMKTEMKIISPATGVVKDILCRKGREVRGGERIMVVCTD
ncbi:5-oxoprolinase/urea amidolyase family protein [Acetobacter lambici]|uniref:5-oxoprolinase/urea amidolyase family protein n=1 Tax=Acetobacter lambici TaxID=1332824 RepID=A0ABT1F270_9PROT|nr:5-oxoprolinase/urea amidolyase family protein [Acetobacter lambici]MCP1243318.1 5-oxoprolinase/urea amidolyase family protein [Acetobacter lambici]MCP1259307.1 5-oxoprolinase/urea amidolyase family protein [Acetobacter lambici]NHO57508.1 5-oxoprolinase/urea amidolyase family protein [Acetobacter lambici]